MNATKKVNTFLKGVSPCIPRGFLQRFVFLLFVWLCLYKMVASVVGGRSDHLFTSFIVKQYTGLAQRITLPDKMNDKNELVVYDLLSYILTRGICGSNIIFSKV